MDLHGTDTSERGIGTSFVRWLHLVPPAGDRARYIERLIRLCRDHRIDAVLPSVPAEIDALSGLSDPVALPSGVPVVCLPRAYRDVFDDKLSAYRALEGFVPLAPYADGTSSEEVRALVKRHGFPVVVKRRTGRGGESFQIAERPRELDAAIRQTPGPVVQSWIDDAGGEYTVGLFATPGRIASIAFRRRLGRTGSSWFAETVDDPEVLRYARAIAAVSRLRGAANVQVRKSSEGVRLLEINARFSSLAPARAVAGFRDVEWSVEQALGLEPRVPESGFRALRFHRFVHEMVDVGRGYEPVPAWSRWSQGKILAAPPGELSSSA
jgi:carbamoyl-phosphate synthase large subunit